MEKVFIYWDNSNVFISACDVAKKREGDGAYTRVRLSFPSLLKLAHADRPVKKAIAVGSVPPPLRQVWERLESQSVVVQLLERGSDTGTEQGVDQTLQVQMLRDSLDNDDPGIAVLLTGDGKGFSDGSGFHADIKRMHNKGWRIEVLSWEHSCKRHMREWVEKNGLFVALDDFYESVTYLEDGHPYAARHAKPLDLTQRTRRAKPD